LSKNVAGSASREAIRPRIPRRLYFIFRWGWLFNGVLLNDIYAETPNLWRTENEMRSFFTGSFFPQALVVFPS